MVEIEKIKEIIEEFFQKTEIKIEIKDFYCKENTIFVSLKTNEAQVLIGEKGQNLLSFQYLLKNIIKKKTGENLYLDLDINDYKQKKILYLKEMAREIANEVALSKKEKVLEPMPAYERRIIHLELANRSDITTESIGKEPERRVVIRPYP